MNKYYTPKKPEPRTCPHNEGVPCSIIGRHCEKCGWNPEVAEARIEKFCNEHGIPYPLPQREEEEE